MTIYFDKYEQVFAHWENDLHEAKCVPSSISPEHISDELENQFDWKKIFFHWRVKIDIKDDSIMYKFLRRSWIVKFFVH